MRVLIVDDEPPARRRLRRLLRTVPDAEIVGEAGDGASAVARIRELAPDLVLLDIQMPDRDGFGVLEALERPLPAVIFVTAHDSYGPQAFEVNALDYLLKPFEDERFHAAIDRARELLAGDRLDRHRAAIERLVSEHGDDVPARLAVRRGETTHLIEWRRIDWVSAEGNRSCLHLRDGREVGLTRSLGALERELPGGFVRVHRSSIVNARRVVRLHALFHGDCVVELEGGAQVRASRTYAGELRRVLGVDRDAGGSA